GHPTTDRYIPKMATHWAIREEGRVVYYKLDPDARWSDGKPVTADDYLFTIEMMKSPYTVEPFWRNWLENYIESVEKIDDYTICIRGKQSDWKPLETLTLFPMPRHATSLTADWVTEANNVFPVVPGPYVITETIPGKRVVLSRVKNWWGDKKHYFQGMYNVDRIVIDIIPNDQAFDYFKKGQISFYYANTAKIWAEDTNYEDVAKGWVRKRQVFLLSPAGIVGLQMNLEAPIFRNKDFRKAMQYLFPFESINQNLMYNSYYRKISTFDGTEFANPEIKPYGFNPRLAREHLEKAGYRKRGPDGILVNDKGEKAAFSLTYGSQSMTRHFTVVQETMKKAGVNVELRLLEGATAFNRALERKYEMIFTGWTADFYPDPNQYFHSKFKAVTNNNNVWGFGTPETDALMETFMFDMDREKRIQAMHKLDAIIQDEAFYIPTWDAPYLRFLYWDYVCWPEFYLPKRAQSIPEWQVFWIDPAKEQRLKDAMAKKETIPGDTEVMKDPYGVKKALDEKTK
ncbi:MAG TPA: extracellular solute-binding protein, partial [Candidatus Sumerlaeota bacterium]|nr:extracellular solute-binding protein [Candidatus Sumerlaeota bacterium]